MTCDVTYGLHHREMDHGSPLWLYFVLVAGIIVLPGMDMAFVLGSSLTGGRRAGLAAVAGIVAGGILHVLMSAAGIGLVLASAPRLFNALLVAGALYVGWIGWTLWRHAAAFGDIDAQASRTTSSTFARAVATCLLNPKAYVFMIAVFPQFIRVDAESFVAQAITLSAITALTQTAVYGAIALAAARVRRWLRVNATAQVRLGRAVAGLLMLAAAWTATQGWRMA